MRTSKLKMKSKKMKKTKSKKIKGGGGADENLKGLIQPELSQSYTDECRTPRCISCRYFAIKAYLLKIGYEDIDGVLEKYNKGILHQYAIKFVPSNLNELPDFAPIFITAKEQTITSPLHAFIIRRKTIFLQAGKKRKKITVYSIDSSWGQSRAAQEYEWLNHVVNRHKLGQEPINQEEYYIDEITHEPTTQRLFDRDTLYSMLINIPNNLQTLFGLSNDELDCINITDFQNVDLYLFNPTKEQLDV
jgi:hypothetical protein